VQVEGRDLRRLKHNCCPALHTLQSALTLKRHEFWPPIAVYVFHMILRINSDLVLMFSRRKLVKLWCSGLWHSVLCSWMQKPRREMLPIYSTLKRDTSYSSDSVVSTHRTTQFHNLEDDSINSYYFPKHHNPLDAVCFLPYRNWFLTFI
jgi:hypothetical protein